jgi:hypothetical protein
VRACSFSFCLPKALKTLRFQSIHTPGPELLLRIVLLLTSFIVLGLESYLLARFRSTNSSMVFTLLRVSMLIS